MIHSTELELTKRQFSREIVDLLDVHLSDSFTKLVGQCHTTLSNPKVPCLILSGKPGNNRRAAVYLAAYSQKITIASPKIGRFFSKKTILNDLKTSLANALTENEKTVFILEPFMLSSKEIKVQIFTTLNYRVYLQTCHILRHRLKVTIFETINIFGLLL